MLTDDNTSAAASIAAEPDLDYRAELLPADKTQAIKPLPETGKMSIIDGINDAPALKVVGLIRLSRSTMTIIRQTLHW